MRIDRQRRGDMQRRGGMQRRGDMQRRGMGMVCVQTETGYTEGDGRVERLMNIVKAGTSASVKLFDIPADLLSTVDSPEYVDVSVRRTTGSVENTMSESKWGIDNAKEKDASTLISETLIDSILTLVEKMGLDASTDAVSVTGLEVDVKPLDIELNFDSQIDQKVRDDRKWIDLNEATHNRLVQPNVTETSILGFPMDYDDGIPLTKITVDPHTQSLRDHKNENKDILINILAPHKSKILHENDLCKDGFEEKLVGPGECMLNALSSSLKVPTKLSDDLQFQAYLTEAGCSNLLEAIHSTVEFPQGSFCTNKSCRHSEDDDCETTIPNFLLDYKKKRLDKIVEKMAFDLKPFEVATNDLSTTYDHPTRGLAADVFDRALNAHKIFAGKPFVSKDEILAMLRGVMFASEINQHVLQHETGTDLLWKLTPQLEESIDVILQLIGGCFGISPSGGHEGVELPMLETSELMRRLLSERIDDIVCTPCAARTFGEMVDATLLQETARAFFTQCRALWDVQMNYRLQQLGEEETGAECTKLVADFLVSGGDYRVLSTLVSQAKNWTCVMSTHPEGVQGYSTIDPSTTIAWASGGISYKDDEVSFHAYPLQLKGRRGRDAPVSQQQGQDSPVTLEEASLTLALYFTQPSKVQSLI